MAKTYRYFVSFNYVSKDRTEQGSGNGVYELPFSLQNYDNIEKLQTYIGTERYPNRTVVILSFQLLAEEQ